MEKTNFEKENDKNDIALFRFAIIAPLINNSCEYKSKEEFFRNAALKKYILPNGKEITVNPGTIRLGKKDFEVPQKYIKQRIIVKYSPEDLSFIYIYNDV